MTIATPPAASNRLRVAVVGGIVAVLLAGLAVFLLVRGDGAPSRGPLGTEDITGMGVSQQAGKLFSIGLPVVYNRGDRPATLDSVSLVEKTPGLEVVESYANGPDRKYLLNATTSFWPAPKEYTDLRPVRRTVVAPQSTREGERGIEFVFVLRVPSVGAEEFKGVQVDYHVGDERHRSVLWEGARICARKRLPDPPPSCEVVDLAGKDY